MKSFIILIISSAITLANNVTSFYSSIDSKHVAVLENSEHLENPEIDYFVELCPGYAGYELLHQGGDGRSTIEIKFGNKISDLYRETFKLSPGTFSHVTNDLIEWRGLIQGKSFNPHAIIYRYTGIENEETQTKKSILIVIALNNGEATILGACSGKDESKKARLLADSALKKEPKSKIKKK